MMDPMKRPPSTGDPERDALMAEIMSVNDRIHARSMELFGPVELPEDLTMQQMRVLGLVAIPSTLPAPAALIALATRSPRAAAALVATLGLKAASMALLRHRVLGTPESPATIAAEVAADLLQPWHAAAGMVRPRQIQWRTRAIRLDGDGVTYA